MNSPARRIAVEEAVAYGFLTALGAYAFINAFDYPVFNEGNRIGPGLLPAIIGGLITLISGVLLVLTLIGRRAEHDHGMAEVAQSVVDQSVVDRSVTPTRDEAEDGLDIFGRTAAYRMRQLQLVIVALVVAVLSVPLFGLLGAMALFCLFASIVVERRPVLSSVLITGTSIAVIYLVFSFFLEVPLPTGFLGIGG